MTTLLFLFFTSFLLTLAWVAVQYRRRSRQQEISFDCRLQQHLIEHRQQLPRPFVRVWYGGSDVQTHLVAPTRQQILSDVL